MTRQQRRAEERARARKARQKVGTPPTHPLLKPRGPDPEEIKERQLHLDVLRLRVRAFAETYGIAVRETAILLRQLAEVGAFGADLRLLKEIVEVANGEKEMEAASPDTEARLEEYLAEADWPSLEEEVRRVRD